MSSLILTEIHCDSPDCYEFIEAHADSMHPTKPRITQARKVAREKYGWVYTKIGSSMYDFCPSCHNHIEDIVTQMQNQD